MLLLILQVLELSSSYSPVVSEYKVGTIVINNNYSNYDDIVRPSSHIYPDK